jgi:hypothetical protein
VDHDSDFVEVVDDIELIFPDDTLCFPLVSGLIELDISAVDQARNESDMTRHHVFVDFASPKPH